ncbi:MAG: gluconokinase [Bryobacteraceae bacterium]
MTDIHILSLDAGTSSVRTLLFDGEGNELDGFGSQIPYQVSTTQDGGVEIDADHLSDLAVQSISAIHEQARAAKIRPAAVAFDTFWHNVLGVDGNGRPTTPVIHVFDTRSAGAAQELARRIDNREQHARTGCVLHASYLPAKLLWLSQSRPEAFRASKRWMSFGEYFFLKILGHAAASTSMMSGTGLWDQNLNDYDDGILNALPVEKDQFCPRDQIDGQQTSLCPPYAALWPEFNGIPWYPALGDGACNNVGSGCVLPHRYALMVGTSGAMRAVCESDRITIPEGLWCYRVDTKRFVMGGALSNGGNVFAWMERNLAVPHTEQVEKELETMTPGSHGLTVLPLFAGERSTKWRAEARAAIAGLSVHTSPMEILQASLESVALRFRNIYDIMEQQLGPPTEVIASGGALLHSPAWTRMMADALGQPVRMCIEKEATGRGAALLALERLGAIAGARDVPARMGAVYPPEPAHKPVYDRELAAQRRLYTKLFEEN